MTAVADTTTKKPWYKKIWIWIIVGAVLVVGGIVNLVNPKVGNDAEPTSSPTPTTATVETPAAEPEERSAPAAVVPTSAEFEQSLKTALGGIDQFSDLYATDPSLWGGYIAGVRVEGSNAYVTLQVAPGDETRDDLGERAAKSISTLLPAADVEGISWIIVEDASGAVIAQEQPRPLS